MGSCYSCKADFFNRHCDHDIVIMFKRKHLNGVSISTYGTLGLGEALVSEGGDIGTMFKHMFETSEEYGDYPLSCFITLKQKMIKYHNLV